MIQFQMSHMADGRISLSYLFLFPFFFLFLINLGDNSKPSSITTIHRSHWKHNFCTLGKTHFWPAIYLSSPCETSAHNRVFFSPTLHLLNPAQKKEANEFLFFNFKVYPKFSSYFIINKTFTCKQIEQQNWWHWSKLWLCCSVSWGSFSMQFLDSPLFPLVS